MNAQRKDKWMCNWKMLKWPPKKVNECLCGYGWMDEDPMVTQCMVGAVKRGHSATTMERRLQEQATKQTKTMLSHVSRLFIPFQVCSYSDFDDRLSLHPNVGRGAWLIQIMTNTISPSGQQAMWEFHAGSCITSIFFVFGQIDDDNRSDRDEKSQGR